MTAQNTISAAVDAERQRRGWSQAQLANALGWGTDQVSRKLTGKRRWSPEDMDLLSERLGIPLPVLLMAPVQAVTVRYRACRAVITRKYGSLISHVTQTSHAAAA